MYHEFSKIVLVCANRAITNLLRVSLLEYMERAYHEPFFDNFGRHGTSGSIKNNNFLENARMATLYKGSRTLLCRRLNKNKKRPGQKKLYLLKASLRERVIWRWNWKDQTWMKTEQQCKTTWQLLLSTHQWNTVSEKLHFQSSLYIRFAIEHRTHYQQSKEVAGKRSDLHHT